MLRSCEIWSAETFPNSPKSCGKIETRGWEKRKNIKPEESILDACDAFGLKVIKMGRFHPIKPLILCCFGLVLNENNSAFDNNAWIGVN